MNGIVAHKNQIQNYGHGIVSQNCVAEWYSESKVSVKVVHIGTFVQVHSVRDNKVFFCIVRDDMQVEMNQMVCKRADIINVPENLWGPLFTVKKEERLSLVKDSKVAESIGNISVGHTVLVFGPNNSVICIGNVVFRNSIGRLGVGIYFGLQVLHSRESLQAVIKKVSLLEPGTKGFPRGCDIVVTVDKIRPSNCNFNKERTVCHFDREYKQHLVKSLSIGEDFNSASFHTGSSTYGTKDRHSLGHQKDQQIIGSDIKASMNHSYVKKVIESELPLNVGDDMINTEDPEKGVIKRTAVSETSTAVGVELDHSNCSGTGTVDDLGMKEERNRHGLCCIEKNLQKSCQGDADDLAFYKTGAPSRERNFRTPNGKEQSLLAKKANRAKDPEADAVYDVPPGAICRAPAFDESWRTLRGKKDLSHSEHATGDENHANYRESPKPAEDLGVGSLVEVTYRGEPHFGVIRWIGTLFDEREDCSPGLVAGIEMEEESPGFTDGTFNGKRYFQCNPGKALFVPLSMCRKDPRFLEESLKQSKSAKVNYGQIDCPIVEGMVAPINRQGDLESIFGKNRGIQGHHNSCYLDATLFSMFAFTSVFDSLLYRPPTKSDIPEYCEVQRVLREEIVNPLRKNLYVRADRVMKLRTLLDKLSSVSGLTSEEKDPEEFLNSLLAQIMKVEPFLKLSSGQEAFHYQLFVEKDERLVLPSVQQLFEQSFVTSDIKLKQVPSCLIIQMPRFGKTFKMYSRILPPQLLDITDIIENSPRQCTVCGKLAEYECKDCFGQQGIGNGLESISFCKLCLDTAHGHYCRSRHNARALTVPVEFFELQEHCGIPRLYMELFAVVCIETSHYVTFVKCGNGSDAPWCFFDSMADRKGEKYGYNIPEIVPCPDLPYWLSEDGAKKLNEMRDDRQLPEHAKRLFSDAYMCMYQSADLMMYRPIGGKRTCSTYDCEKRISGLIFVGICIEEIKPAQRNRKKTGETPM